MLEKQIIHSFVSIVGEDNVDTSNMGRLTYSYDATPNFQAMPDAVIAPRNTNEVAEVLKVCNTHKIPVYVRGSGTNLCAGTCPLEGGIVLIFRHMNNILEIDEENLTITVQAGVITLDIIRTGGKLAKDVAGYDLTRLFIGSEGTLGVVTEAILKLVPIPETKKTMLALYEDINEAARAVSSIIANKIIPATLEFLDQPTIEVVEEFAQIGLPTDVKAILLIEQDGPPEVVNRDIENMANVCRSMNAVDVRIAKDETEADALRTARRSALSALARLKPTTILEDATVPRSQIAPMVEAINAIAKKYNIPICTFGHAGDGNLHPTCMTDARNAEEMHRAEQAFAEIFAKAIELGGTITGEHGVGAMKAPYLEMKLGKEGIAAMQGIKQAFDPNNIMNPGKIFAKDTRKRVVVER
ncbi:FAD-linked oxidase C-terminal domain-containing protein [Bacillus thuringiensis]|uniref:Glycolate oxidase subunit GlcD n=1 Tax=Bacillus thuringiensis subsp. higo TaxID=132266 RepID=A0A9X6QKW0_BACUH|nr:FAD-linked oxidase C-terminal domain-containing protein [Bacillus thuringiensis]OUB42756.1 glycolate oxidase subunit GlcD [Bacillus thuringiensis serovar higo]